MNTVIDEAQFDAIVSGFYSAATGTCSWNEALAPVHAAFGTRGTVMQSVDLQTGRLLHHAHAPRDNAVLDYLRHWHEQDPRRQKLLAEPTLMIDRWWHCHEHFDDDFASRDPFYQHFLLAHGTRYLATTATLVSPTLLTSFTLELPAARGPLSIEERQLAERLGRHVAEALRAHERVRQLAAQALAGHELLDSFSHPMWLLDGDRFVFYANAAAREAQRADERLGSNGQRLLLAQPADADRQLGLALNQLALGRHGQRALLSLRQRPSDPPSWLHLQALAPGRVLGAFGDRPRILATMFDPQQTRALDAFALGDLFGMTPTEARVACLLAEGLSAPAIAAQLGCAQATVRTHLRQVLFKLGATRLADAVRLLRQGEALWARPAAWADH